VNRLDKAGRCSFEVPAADPRAREVLANKREAHYYTLRGGTPTEVGALIIDKIETVVAGREEPMLRVEGDNLLAELATRTVGALELYDVEAHTAHRVAHTYLYEGEYRTADMPAAYDGNAGTSYALDTGLKAGDYLYVCGESKVSCVWVAFGAGANGVQATMGAQYYDGYGWLDCQNIQDTTSSAGRTFAQNGGIRFTRPADQVQTTHNGVEGYWIRLTPSVDLSDGIIIAEMFVDEDVPTGTGLADIMAYAPPGWSVSGGYATTKSTAYMQFANESVLEALVALAEHTGEHFRLGVGKRIEWLRDDPEVAPVDSGVYALAAPATAANACTILELSESKDSYELATRVYPYGGRQGNGRVSLARCTETPPAGYTLSTTDNYIKADVAENTYGRIDTTREWPDVGQQDEGDYHAVLAANALYAVALEWLKRHSQVQRAYTLRVAHLERQVRPGETVRVTYQRARDGERYVDIDGALVVLGVTLEESGDGIRTAALELATTDTWPLSGTDFLLREIRGSRRGRAGGVSTTTITQTIVSAQVNIDGGTIDGTAIGSNVPASGVFSTVAVKGVAALQGGAAVTGNIAVTGTVDGVDVSAHAADPGAHHAPVTVSNQGLSLSGQALGLKLAATPGLEIVSGLRLGTPATLTAATLNTVTAASHAHAVTALASTVGGEEALLKSDEMGGLGLAALTVGGAATVGEGLTAAGSAFRVVHHTHDQAHAHVAVNPSPTWTLDEQFGVDIDDSLLVRGFIVGRHALQIADAAMICHFDGPEPYETDFTGNPTGHRGQVATVTGGIIYRPGRFGKAVQIAEATTNLLPNPSVETNTTGFVFARDGTAPVRERSAAAAWIGGYGLRWVIGSSPQTLAHVQQPTGASPSGGQPYTLSVYVRGVGSAVGNAVYLTIVESGGATGDEETSGPNVTLTTEWQRLTHTHTVLRSDRTNLHGRLVCPAPVAGNELHLDGWQVEKKAYATPYADGSLGAGHSWTGTAHASASTRAAARLSYALDLPTVEGTIAGWFRASAGWVRLLWYAVGGSSTYATTWLQVDDSLLAYWGDSTLTSAAGIWPADDAYHHVVVTRSATEQRIYLDGQVVASGALSVPYVNAGNPLGVGCVPNGSQQLNGLIDDLVIVARCLDADEVRAIYESDAPVFAETSTWQWRAARNLVWADAEGLWGVDEAGDPMFAVSGTARSWGGANLGPGDVLIGNVSQGHYLHWDDSEGKLSVRGDVAVSGSVLVTWSEISDPPEGAARLGTGTAPGSAGLWLTGSRFGYFDGSAWQTYIDNTGKFQFGPTDAGNLLWTGTKLQGRKSTTVQWETDATTGAIVAGGGKTCLDANGLRLQQLPGSGGFGGGRNSSVRWEYSTSLVAQVVAWENSGAEAAQALDLIVRRGRPSSTDSRKLSLGYYEPNNDSFLYSDVDSVRFTGNLSVSGGLNVGNPTKAAGAGGIMAKNYVGVGIDYTPGTGNIDAAAYVRGQKGLIVGEKQTAPTAYVDLAFIWVDSSYNLKVTFGDGTTKTIISKA
jgi:hypothetical protein